MSSKILCLLGFLLLFCIVPVPSTAESSTCLTVYKEGGAPAVFQSPKCPRWNLFPDDRRGRPVYNCQVAVNQGRRRSQEDQAVCVLDVRVPFTGISEVKDINLGVIAVFDGHNGAEASEMASKLLLEYFFLHVHFLLDGIYSATLPGPSESLIYSDGLIAPTTDMGQHWLKLDPERYQWISPKIFDGNFHLDILKESLLRTIRDIDSAFSEEASRKNLDSGSTAAVVLIADGHILAANVGDSKAILCSENSDPPNDLKGGTLRLDRKRRQRDVTSPTKRNRNYDVMISYERKYIHVKELTKDHHPDRDDEKSRVEAAGGYVEWSGVPRVNGGIAVSRAIGDVSFKSYGVISTPEVTDWQPLSSNDTYLVVASDGIFDKLTTQDTCDLLCDANIEASLKSEMFSLADYIVKTAFESGSMDNLAAVVVPLRPSGISRTLSKDSSDVVRSTKRPEQLVYQKSGNDDSHSSLISVEYFNRIMANFSRLVVETNNRKLGCFYLSENLNEEKDRDCLPPKDYAQAKMHGLSHGLSEALVDQNDGRAKRLFSDKRFCSLLGLEIDGAKGRCIDPDSFQSFLGLLGSFPCGNTGYTSGNSPQYKIPDFRYTLERQFGGGTYGEVWLAYQWNCSEAGPNKYNIHCHVNSSCSSDVDNDNSFILKRIKLERGNIAYLSGLREKYFGEMFLNAFMSSRGLTTAGLSISFPPKADNAFDVLLRGGYVTHGMQCTSTSIYAHPRNFILPKATSEEGLEHIARFVESFESPSGGIWLVFHNEGLSLKKLVYTGEAGTFTNHENNSSVKNMQMFHASSWWHWLRTTVKGRKEMRNLLRQLLMALKSCHVRNITHRDIKPENIIICFEDVNTGRCLRRIQIGVSRYNLRLRLIDFGSALDEFSVKNLYGSGPTRSEQTWEYTPPEALLNRSWFQAPERITTKYDMWSVGAVIMELVLGTSNIFQTSTRTRAIFYQLLEGWDENVKELANTLRSYMEMCISVPGISLQHHHSEMAMDCAGLKCSEESFSQRVKNRDPLKLGFPNVWALRLVRQLLVWNPEDRLSADDALQHPYFQSDL